MGKWFRNDVKKSGKCDKENEKETLKAFSAKKRSTLNVN